MVKDIPYKWKQKESRGSHIHIRKDRFKTKTITKDTAEHYFMVKGSIQEDITFINICALNIKANVNGHEDQN